MFPRVCFVLSCALSAVVSQHLEKSVFKQLTAAELREIDLTQNPRLLDMAARTGESVVINITESSQGAIVQDRVDVLMDCYPWLSNFPGGTIRWYLHRYLDLDHTMLGMRKPQTKEDLVMSNSSMRISGEFDRYYNITRVRIQQASEDPHRGVYECEVCVRRSTPSEVCYIANVTLAVAGRPPLLNSAYGTSKCCILLYVLHIVSRIYMCMKKVYQILLYCPSSEGGLLALPSKREDMILSFPFKLYVLFALFVVNPSRCLPYVYLPTGLARLYR